MTQDRSSGIAWRRVSSLLLASALVLGCGSTSEGGLMQPFAGAGGAGSEGASGGGSDGTGSSSEAAEPPDAGGDAAPDASSPERG
jgi:hypothetical protein